MGATLTNTRPKTTICLIFREQFSDISCTPNEMFRRFVVIDEIWIHHYTHKSNKKSLVGNGESPAKTQK